ncbi:MAG TPA: hypothetical protein VNU21_06320 [Usitatibacter sp.]|nr:hypothetical protein [Usitatibacter sp.]
MKVPGAAHVAKGLAFLAAMAIAAIVHAASSAADSSPGRDPGALAASIRIDGPPLRVPLQPAGRGARVSFMAEAGQRLGFGIAGVRFTPASAAALVVTVRQPDGSMVPGTRRVHCFAAKATEPVCDGELTTQQAGRHVLEIDAPFSAAATLELTLSSPVTASLQVGKSHTIAVSRAGQDARLELALEPGADVSISARSAGAQAAGPRAFDLRAFRPDGSLAAEAHGDAQRAASLSLPGAAGLHAIEIDPANGATGAFVVSAKAGSVAAVGGPAAEFSVAAGETARFAVAGNAGQGLTIAVQGLAHAPDVDYGNSVIALLKPDGGRLDARSCITKPLPGLAQYVPPCKLSVFALPESGRYTVTVSPPAQAAASGRLLLADVVTGSLAAGAPAKLAAMKPAQVARFEFTGSAGQNVQLSAFATVPPGAAITLLVQGLDGTSFFATAAGNKERIAMFNPLPSAGRYVVTVDPGYAAIETGELALVDGQPR